MAIAEALNTGSREGRMVGNAILDTESAEPAIGEVDLQLAAEGAL